jgi:hypothetical protein
VAQYPTEPKVVAATSSAGLAAIVAGYVNWQIGVSVFHASASGAKVSEAVAAVPQPLSALLLAAIPAAAALIGGYLAPHAARPPEPVKAADNAVVAEPVDPDA